jgi:hypothetical protein
MGEEINHYNKKTITLNYLKALRREQYKVSLMKLIRSNLNVKNKYRNGEIKKLNNNTDLKQVYTLLKMKLSLFQNKLNIP